MSACHFVILALAFGKLTAAVRVRSSQSFQTKVGTHSYNQLIDGFHANLSTAKWSYTQRDWQIMKGRGGVLDLVNKISDGSPNWEWSPDGQHWTYPFTIHHRDQVAALALHMLHRHGMAPFTASKDIAAFDKFYKATAPTKSVLGFVEAVEQFPVVKEIFTKMKSMSLDGLRNVHSYDHTWSTITNAGAGCNHGGASEKCLLQASFSKNAHKLMGKYGFTASTKDKLRPALDTYADKIWYKSQSRKTEMEGRLNLWAYEEAGFFRLK